MEYFIVIPFGHIRNRCCDPSQRSYNQIRNKQAQSQHQYENDSQNSASFCAQNFQAVFNRICRYTGQHDARYLFRIPRHNRRGHFYVPVRFIIIIRTAAFHTADDIFGYDCLPFIQAVGVLYDTQLFIYNHYPPIIYIR